MAQQIEKINYQEIIEKNPWIVEKNKKAIISPDIDGLLCGLFISYYLDWEIVGFYDGKILLLENEVSARDCIFLDMEILRENICSLGHHMNTHNFNELPKNYRRCMTRCINPNYLRGFDRIHYFSRKYPLGSIHLLIPILETKYPNLVKIKKEGLASLFFADGVWKILFKYTNNVLDWFNYLGTEKESIWWQELKQISVSDLIEEINSLLNSFKEIHHDNKNWYGHIDISDMKSQNKLLIETLNLISNLIGWNFKNDRWLIGDLKKYNFTKKIFTGLANNVNFFEIFEENPLSLAMTEGSTIQYTIETPDTLP